MLLEKSESGYFLGELRIPCENEKGYKEAVAKLNSSYFIFQTKHGAIVTIDGNGQIKSTVNQKTRFTVHTKLKFIDGAEEVWKSRVSLYGEYLDIYPKTTEVVEFSKEEEVIKIPVMFKAGAVSLMTEKYIIGNTKIPIVLYKQ